VVCDSPICEGREQLGQSDSYPNLKPFNYFSHSVFQDTLTAMPRLSGHCLARTDLYHFLAVELFNWKARREHTRSTQSNKTAFILESKGYAPIHLCLIMFLNISFITVADLFGYLFFSFDSKSIKVTPNRSVYPAAHSIATVSSFLSVEQNHSPQLSVNVQAK
jgi:hypothetical protein